MSSLAKDLAVYHKRSQGEQGMQVNPPPPQDENSKKIEERPKFREDEFVPQHV